MAWLDSKLTASKRVRAISSESFHSSWDSREWPDEHECYSFKLLWLHCLKRPVCTGLSQILTDSSVSKMELNRFFALFYARDLVAWWYECQNRDEVLDLNPTYTLWVCSCICGSTCRV